MSSATGSSGPLSASVYGNWQSNSDGYRENNDYKQTHGVGDFRYTVQRGQRLPQSFWRRPGRRAARAPRRVDPRVGMNQLVTDRRGATRRSTSRASRAQAQPRHHPHAGAGRRAHRRRRHPEEKAAGAVLFCDTDGRHSEPANAVDTDLTTSSLTPRVKLNRHCGRHAVERNDRHRLLPGHVRFRPLAFLGARRSTVTT